MEEEIPMLSAPRVRYIKLGEKGTWAKDCLAKRDDAYRVLDGSLL